MSCITPNGCGHEFCWLCLEVWNTDLEVTGGYFGVHNCIVGEVKKDNFDRDKSAVGKCMFYFEKYDNN